MLVLKGLNIQAAFSSANEEEDMNVNGNLNSKHIN